MRSTRITYYYLDDSNGWKKVYFKTIRKKLLEGKYVGWKELYVKNR